MAQRAVADIKDLAEGRNDFVHAAYFARHKDEPDKPFVYFADENEPILEDGTEAVAVRVRSQKTVPVEKLQAVRDSAAVVSIRIAHFHWVTIIQSKYRDWQSPWLDKLAELPALEFPKPAARSAKGRKSQPQPSRKKR